MKDTGFISIKPIKTRSQYSNSCAHFGP